MTALSFLRRVSFARLLFSAVPVLVILSVHAHGQSTYATPYTSNTFAGQAGTGSQGSTDGTAGAARFFNPTGVAVDGSGNIFVADNNNHTIREISPSG